MSANLFFVSLIFGILIVLLIFYLLLKNKVNLKYSIIWLILFPMLIICLLVPSLMNHITKLLGFYATSNMVLSLIISILIFISISLTVIVSSHEKKIRLLIQEISILNKKLNENKKSGEN